MSRRRAMELEAMKHPEYQRWMRDADNCDAGRCRYNAAPQPSHDYPPSVDLTTHCSGCAGSFWMEDGALILRVAPCSRQRAWWDQKRGHFRERRAADSARHRQRLSGDDPA